MDGIRGFIRVANQLPLSALCQVKAPWQVRSVQPEEGFSPDLQRAHTQISDFQYRELWKRNFCCLSAIQPLYYFVGAAHTKRPTQTQTISYYLFFRSLNLYKEKYFLAFVCLCKDRHSFQFLLLTFGVLVFSVICSASLGLDKSS